MILSIILIITLILAYSYIIYKLIRNHKICKFRIMIITSIKNWEDYYYKLPSYKQQLRSTDKLKLETYFSQEEIDKIIYHDI